jgi:hypothetical protein
MPVIRKLVTVNTVADLELAIDGFHSFCKYGFKDIPGDWYFCRDFDYGYHRVTCKIVPRKILGISFGTKQRIWVDGIEVLRAQLPSVFN